MSPATTTGLWAVADGMGGHEGGEWASGRIVRELGRVETDKGFEASCAAATEAILAANRADPRRGQEARQAHGLDPGHADRRGARATQYSGSATAAPI